FNWGLERFINYVSDNRPTHIDVATEHEDSGTDHIVTEHFARFTGYYDGRKSVVAKKKYGGTTSKPEEMEPVLDADIQRLQELKIDIFKIKGFIDE
ncbi:hypothetical protein KY310_01300, partial [Candidatus Woesearchaeota archaeon]|nr:hypothetical protein [Candidatus Woesearchaeota archaeon]